MGLSKLRSDNCITVRLDLVTNNIVEEANKRRRTKVQIDNDNKAAAEEADRVRRIED